MDILLNKNKSKISTNVNNSIPIELVGRNRILPVDRMTTNVNEIELYNDERKSSNIIRLTCTINPICTNVLFNNVTEIVINEGSDKCESLNYKPLNEMDNYENKLIYKQTSHFENSYDGVRDTQLSNSANGFSYYCGLDIFNNHILRSNTFKTVCKNNNNNDSFFNTISDYMRDNDGNIIKGYSDAYVGTQNPNISLHLYLADDILSFKECVSERLIDKNGWLGFTNIGKFGTYGDNNQQFDIYKVINSRKSCDFIDMYPSRDLWYFTPKYNKHRKRIEKNWNYCLTYPSSHTTDVDFIRDGTNSLKACMFDDILTNSVGTSGLKIYSISMHGLSKGDIVNIYSGDDIVIRNANVVDVDNEYIFSIYDNGIELSKDWKEISNEEFMEKKFEYENVEYSIIGSSYKYASDDSGKTKYPILPNNKVNLNKNMLDISYKKVVEGNELSYYVRKFTRLPNWKYSDIKPTEFELYRNGSNLIYNNQTIDKEFENHVSKLAFSKNIYNDDVSQIVFTDDIDISNLRDNLGRPLTEIYLTIFKNNQGYRDWYGIDKRNSFLDDTELYAENGCITNSDNIEYSHCFGKLTCGFRLSKESLYDDNLVNSVTINRIDSNHNGIKLRDSSNLPIDDDEIQYNKLDYINNGIKTTYKGDIEFYGDLCCYSDVLLDEYTIQPIEFRFNTAQRELTLNDISYEYLRYLQYDEIEEDDYDNLTTYNDNSSNQTNFKLMTSKIDDVCQRKEGYVYNPHFKIQVRTFSDSITTQKPYYFTIKDIDIDNIYTLEKNYFSCHDKFILRALFYDSETSKYITKFIDCEVTEVLNNRKFKYISNGDVSGMDINQTIRFGKLIKASEDVPNYASFFKDGSCYYMWRDIIPNGYDDIQKVENYPFTNGAFYINKTINLFVRRQDPKGEGKLQSTVYPYDKNSNQLDYTVENNYYQEQDIEC